MCKYKTLIAICSIILIEFYALSQGINGSALSVSVACLAGLGGYEINKKMGS